MITKVKLKNWKSHKDSELDFAGGTNGLVGIVGSGKTSILDAICFVLFGTFPTLQTRKVKLEDIIMKKPTEEMSSEVEVHFSINGNSYSVKRMIEKDRGTSYSEIRENGKIIESPSTKNVTTCVENILKVNYELFSKAIYSEQNSIDYFLNLGKGQRMKKIDELLMIDKFEKARTNSVSLTNKLENVKIGKQSNVDRLDPSVIIQSISDLKKSIDEMTTKKSRLITEMEKASISRANLEKEADELRNVMEEFEKIRRDKSSVESAIKETSDMLSNLENILKESEGMENITGKLEQYSQKIDDMNKFLSEKQTSYLGIQNNLSESKAKIQLLRGEKISSIEKDLEEKMMVKKEFEHLRDTTGENVDEQLKEKKTVIENLIGKVMSLTSKIKEMDELLEKLSSVGGKCPICDSSLSEERKNMLLIERRRDLDNLKASLERTKSKREIEEENMKRLQEAMKKLDEMFSRISDMDKVRSDLDTSKKLLVEHSTIAEKLEGELGSMKTEIEIIQKELESASTIKHKLDVLSTQSSDYEMRKKRLEELKTSKTDLDNMISVIEEKMGDRELRGVEEKLRQVIANEKEAETKISNFDSVMKEKMERLSEYEKNLESSRKEKEYVEKLDKVIKEMKLFTLALKQTQIELRKEFVEAVNYTMNKLWPTLYPYQDFIGVRLSVEEGDYVLQLQEKATNWINVEGVVSGGERSIACLALRIAFALVLAPHLRVLVLDEPTANLDSNSVKVLSNTLRESISEFIDQCFIITHDEVFEESVTGNAYRMERDKGKNEYTRVIQIS